MLYKRGHLTSVNWIIIDLGNGQAPVQRQAIIQKNAQLMATEQLWKKISAIAILTKLNKIALRTWKCHLHKCSH